MKPCDKSIVLSVMSSMSTMTQKLEWNLLHKAYLTLSAVEIAQRSVDLMNPPHTRLIKAQWQSIDSPIQIVMRAFFSRGRVERGG